MPAGGIGGYEDDHHLSAGCRRCAGTRPEAPGTYLQTSMAMLSFSRRFELQADQLALTILTRAGYGKEGLMSYLTKLPELRETAAFSATPPPQARIAALR